MSDGKKLIRIIGDQPWKAKTALEFHFEEYGSTLAEVALNPYNKTPLCVLVQAEWGVGKSTLMETIKRILDEQDRKKGDGKRTVKAVWFNAWKYKDAAPVMAGLLGALLKEIGKGGLKREFQEQFLKNRGRIAKAIIYAFPAMLDKFLTDGLIRKEIEECSSNVDEILSKCSEIDIFQQAFLEVAAAWVMNKWRDTSKTEIDDKEYCLAVFIDDLDRCDEAQIKAVLEAIKLFLDFPGVCFYLAMDQHQLDHYLKAVFKGRSKDALDKFVQVIFNIPAPPKQDFHDYVKSQLEGHPMGEYIPEEDREILVANLPSNPRAVKRYLNDLAVWFSVFGKINSRLDDSERGYLMPYAARYLLFSHEVQKRDRSRWNAKAGSAESLLNWLRLLKDRANEEPGGEDDFDFHLTESGRLKSLIDWLLDPGNNPMENLGIIVEFRERLAEPTTPAASGRRINPLTWMRIPGSNFEMLAYPVTQGLYKEVTGTNPSRFAGEGTEDHPVESVSWFDAVEFCNALSKRMGMDEVYEFGGNSDKVSWNQDKKGIRLPKEEEWVYACLAGGTEDPYGPLDEIAWYDENAGESTHPVGEKKRNAWDLYDMLGNVREWCWDLRLVNSPHRVLRSSSWRNDSRDTRASNLRGGSPTGKIRDRGFRCVRDIENKEEDV
ncbi:MAG: P-loop NTPase fold protein [Candidatus Lernaella stagnicola]|nr:P-loop NTPase fold protein [Candidatus Lernaella stagnicola]